MQFITHPRKVVIDVISNDGDANNVQLTYFCKINIMYLLAITVAYVRYRLNVDYNSKEYNNKLAEIVDQIKVGRKHYTYTDDRNVLYTALINQ